LGSEPQSREADVAALARAGDATAAARQSLAARTGAFRVDREKLPAGRRGRHVRLTDDLAEMDGVARGTRFVFHGARNNELLAALN